MSANAGIIEDYELVQDTRGNWVTEYPENTIVRCPDGSIWYVNEDRDWDKLGRGSGSLRGPAEILNLPGEPKAQGSDDLDSWTNKMLLRFHENAIREAHTNRPGPGDPASQTYQDTVMAPLIAKQDLLRAAVQEAEQNAGR